jgi:hypothetical protein
MAHAKIATICGQGNGVSPGRPTRVRSVPTTVSPATEIMTVLLGIVAQNQRRSLTEITENAAK